MLCAPCPELYREISALDFWKQVALSSLQFDIPGGLSQADYRQQTEVYWHVKFKDAFILA